MACAYLRMLSLALPLALAGCVSVKTPDEFRTVVRDSSSGSVTTFTAARPLGAVTASFRKKADECLRYELTSTTRGSTYTFAVARGTVEAGSGRSSLLFQVHSVGNLAPEPEGGNFYLVADALAKGGGTQVTVYRAKSVGSAIEEAVRAWADGRERGCPDPMRTFK